MRNDLISIMLPARGRPEGFVRAVSSVALLANRSESVEILVRADDDDLTAYESRQFLAVPVADYRVVRGPRGLGYREVFKMYNALAEISKGAWLVNWNDDVEMLTAGWDELLRQAVPHSVQFLRRDILDSADTTFPCTGRSVYEAMGHMSLQTHADDWMRVVATEANVAVFRNDIVFHHYRLNDRTSYERDHGGYDLEGFRAPEAQAQMMAAAERVRAAAPREK